MASPETKLWTRYEADMDAQDSKRPRVRVEATAAQQPKTALPLEDVQPGLLRDRLQAVFGSTKGPVATQLATLADHEDLIVKWLEGSPEDQKGFREDPIGVLAARFPELGLSLNRNDFERLPGHIGLDIEAGRAQDPVVQELFAKVWAYAAASEANAISFQQAPFAVIATVGVGYAGDKVDTVVRAFEAVFGIVRLERPGFAIATGFASGRVIAALAALAEGGSDAHA